MDEMEKREVIDEEAATETGTVPEADLPDAEALSPETGNTEESLAPAGKPSGKKSRRRRKKSRREKADILYRIIFLVALAVFIFAAVRLIQYGITYWRGSHEYDGLQQYITESIIDAPEGTETEATEFSVDFEGLQALNPDCIGWIRFENIDISYPIMQGEDNEYYLHHTFEGQEITAASIFMDCSNASDFTDDNTFIYGHNMKDKTMFGKLNNYSDEDYYKENSYFYIYTPEYTYRYDIFSCYLAAVAEEESFYTQFGSKEDFQHFIDSVTERSEYDTGVKATSDDHVITLMTCNKAGYDYRFLVHAVQTEAIPVE